jgi:hypothetical protein
VGIRLFSLVRWRSVAVDALLVYSSLLTVCIFVLHHHLLKLWIGWTCVFYYILCLHNWLLCTFWSTRHLVHSSLLVQLITFIGHAITHTSTKQASVEKSPFVQRTCQIRYATNKKRNDTYPTQFLPLALCVSPRAHAPIATPISQHKNAGPWLSTA